MKRLWFAVIFLAAATVICFKEQSFINNYHTEMDKKINASISAYYGGDKDEFEKRINEMKNYWYENNDTVFMIVNHDIPNQIGTALRSVDASDDHIELTLSELSALNTVLYENQRITFSNIL